MKTLDGRVVGEHVGLSFYTYGQRKGIGIGGDKKGTGQPWFAAHKDIQSNTLYVAQGHDHPALLSTQLHAEDASWVAGHAPIITEIGAKTRYRQSDSPCRLNVSDAQHFTLDFSEAQWAVTPGQYAVLYDGEVCLGGGIIAAANPDLHPFK